jgi:hypothetical protein
MTVVLMLPFNINKIHFNATFEFLFSVVFLLKVSCFFNGNLIRKCWNLRFWTSFYVSIFFLSYCWYFHLLAQFIVCSNMHYICILCKVLFMFLVTLFFKHKFFGVCVCLCVFVFL